MGILRKACDYRGKLNYNSNPIAICPDYTAVTKAGAAVTDVGKMLRGRPGVVIIMSVRLWLMGGSMPLFSEQDNPASFSPHLLTRILTYSYLLSFNAWLLLAPIVLCYDWQVGSISLVESLGDVRNVATVLLAVVMVALCLHCVLSLQT
eukprot:superscaffoldBa00002531_g14554